MEDELTVLTADYTATREDHRQALARDVAIVSAGVAVFAAHYYLVAEHDGWLKTRPLLAAALPLAPYLIAQTYIFYMVDSVLRGYYLRALERAIQERVRISSDLGSEVRIPSFGHLAYAIYSTRHGSSQVKLMLMLAVSAVFALYGGSAIISISVLPTTVDRMAALALYVALAGVILWSGASITVRSRHFYLKVFREHAAVFQEPLDLRSPSRNTMSLDFRQGIKYLLLPRPSDLIKLPGFLGSWLITLVAFSYLQSYDVATIEESIIRALLFVLVFELLVYQARYQWNDLRGATQDRTHVARSERRRLPEGWERRSFLTMLLRLAIAAYIVHVIYRSSGVELGVALLIAATPLVIAIPYELLRGISDRIPYNGRWWIRHVYFGIYCVVGVGFAARIAFGVLIGADFSVDPLALTLLFVACWLAGSAETVAIWSLESAVVEESASDEGTSRPHIQRLNPYIRTRVERWRVGRSASAEMARNRQSSGHHDTAVGSGDPTSHPQAPGIAHYPLLKDSDASLTPWLILHLAAVCMSALFGLYLARTLAPAESLGQFRAFLSLESICFVAITVLFAYVLKLIPANVGIPLLAVATLAESAILWSLTDPAMAVAPVLTAGIVLTNLGDRLNTSQGFTEGARAIFRSLRITVSRWARRTLCAVFEESTARRIFGNWASGSTHDENDTR